MTNNLFSIKLLDWFTNNKRKLPWRENRSFYKTWLSEIMLQQTQVKTVIPYFNNWIKKFPDYKSVAYATEDDILKAWEGLGYYSRARNFKKSCEILEKNKMNINKISFLEFLKFPGVGNYTASAVFSIIHNQVHPVIDGNVKRVTSRILRLKKNPDNCMVQIHDYLKTKICLKEPGNFNEAIMELGATICKPQTPNCLKCPINKDCNGYKLNDYMIYPIKKEKKKKPHYDVSAGIIWYDDYIIISKRKASGMLGGLWEFPGGKIEKKETPEQCLKREVKEEININIKINKFLGKIKHEYSHFSITLNAFECTYVSGTIKAIECSEVRKIKLNDISKYPFPKANHKIFKFLKTS